MNKFVSFNVFVSSFEDLFSSFMLVRSFFRSGRGKIWTTIQWHSVERRVLRIQHLISIAVKKGNSRTISGFQKLLVRSSFGRLKSVRQVTQENSLRFIPGSDGEVILSSRKKLWAASTVSYPAKFLRLRRVHFFTLGGSYRSLFVPSISERIEQFLWTLAVAPIVEVVSRSFLYVSSQRLSREVFSLQIKNSLSLFPNIAWVSTFCLDPFQVSVMSSWILLNVPMDKRLYRWWQKNNFLYLT